MTYRIKLTKTEFDLIFESIRIAKAFATLTAYANDNEYKSFNRIVDYDMLMNEFHNNVEEYTND